MSGRLSSMGLIVVGAVAGVAISLGISAYALRDSRGPIPLEEIRQFARQRGRLFFRNEVSAERHRPPTDVCREVL